MSPPRYYLDLDCPEAPTGASNILNTILRGCETEPPKEEKDDGRASEEPPSKKTREGQQPPAADNVQQLSVTVSSTSSAEAGFALVQAATAVAGDSDI